MHYKLTFPLHSALIVNRPVVSLIIVSILVVAVVVILVAMTVRVVVMVTLIPPTGVAVVSMMARPIARRAAIEAVVVSSLGVVVSPALVVTSSRLSAVAGALLLLHKYIVYTISLIVTTCFIADVSINYILSGLGRIGKCISLSFSSPTYVKKE